MTPEPFTISGETPVEEIVELMEKHRIRRLPVVTDGRPIGVVSRANLVQALASLAREAPPGANNDTTIRKLISAEIASNGSLPRAAG